MILNTGWDVRAVFDAHGATPYISSFTLSYEAGVVKPDARIFAIACESLGVDAAEAMMVGDDARSDGGAVTAGMRTLLLPPLPPGSDNGLGSVRRPVHRG